MTDDRHGSTPGSISRKASGEALAAGGGALTAELFHRFVDGELDLAGKDALARAAALDPDVKRRLEGLLEVRAVVRQAVEAQTPEIESEALWTAVEAAIAKDAGTATKPETERARPALRALPGGKVDGTPALPVLHADPAVRIRRIGAAVIGVIAIAAVAFLALRAADPIEVAGVDRTGRPEGDPRPMSSDEPARTEVLEVDFGTNIGTIFAIEGDAGDRYAVVWLDDADMAPTRGPRPESAPGPAAPAPTPN